MLVVKQIRIIMNDEDYEKLQKLKGNKTWRDFIFDLVEFKRKMEQEGEFVPRDSLKEPYVDAAKLLRKLGSLLKVVWREGEDQFKENWQLEAAALLPLYVSGAELTEEEERNLLLVMIMVLEELLNRRYPELSEELKWLMQGQRMLVLHKRELYDLSMDNFTQERSRRQGSSTH